MHTSDQVVKFQGFHPTSFTRLYLTDMIHALHEEAPYGATLRATFSLHDNRFKGMITIHSSAGRFLATTTEYKLKDVSHRLVEQIRKQIGRWKSQRFGHKRSEVTHDDATIVA